MNVSAAGVLRETPPKKWQQNAREVEENFTPIKLRGDERENVISI